MTRYAWTSGRTRLQHGGLPPPMPPGLPQGELPRPKSPGPDPVASPDRGQERPATSRCCARPGGTVPRPEGLPPPILPGRIPPPTAVRVRDRGPRPATTPCSWGRARAVLPPGGLPPPILPDLVPPPSAVPVRSPRPATTRCSWGLGRRAHLPGGLPPPTPPDPARPASCPARPPSPAPAGFLPLPARTRCCRRPGSAGLVRPASPGLRPSLFPVLPARSRCSSGPGCTGRARTARQHGPGRLGRPDLLVPAGSAHTGRVRAAPRHGGLRSPIPPGPGRTGPARTGPDSPRRTDRAVRRPRGARARTMTGRAPGPATPTVPVLNAAPAGPPMAGRARTGRRRRRTGHGRAASARRPLVRRSTGPGRPIRPTPGHGPGRARPARTLRPRGRRLGPAARPGLAGRPGRPGPPGRAAWAAAGRRSRRATRLPSGRNRRRSRESPRAAGRAGASARRCGEPAARSTSWSPPPSSGRDRPPAVGGDRWPVPGRLAAPALAAASGGRPEGTASSLPAWPTGGSSCSRRAAPGEAIRAGIPAAACRGPDGCGAGRAACRPAGAGRWCGLGSRDRPGRRLRPGWGRAGRPAGSHRHRRLRRPSHARHGQAHRPDDSPATSRPRACSPRAVTSSLPRLTLRHSPCSRV